MPTPTYDLITSTTLASSSASVSFVGIPASWRDLVLVADFSTSTTTDMPGIRLNGDSGANYNTVMMMGSGTSVFNYIRTGRTSGWMEWYSATGRQLVICSLFDYTQTNKHKQLLFRRDQANNVTSAGAIRWANTNAVTALTIIAAAETGTGTFTAGTFSLYGIAG
jgi:hypothetical protein